MNHTFDKYWKLIIWKTKLWRKSTIHCHIRLQILSQRSIFLDPYWFILVFKSSQLDLTLTDLWAFSGWKIFNVLGPSSFNRTVAFPDLEGYSCPLHWFIFLRHTCSECIRCQIQILRQEAPYLITSIIVVHVSRLHFIHISFKNNFYIFCWKCERDF